MVQSKIHIPADLIFHQSTEWDDLKFYYLMSKDIPTKRFGIRVDQKYLNYKNEKIKNFKHYGPNEQYLLNRIFDGPKNIIYIVGAIGSGKTTFIRFLTEYIHRENQYNHCKKDCIKKPKAIVIDFSIASKKSFATSNTINITNDIMDMMINGLSEGIGNDYFSFPEEITTVWDRIIRDRKKKASIDGGVFGKIITLIRQEVKRDSIFKEIRINQEYYLEYLCHLLNYINENVYKKKKRCFLIILDNIDQVSPLVQYHIRKIVKSFFAMCSAKCILTLRLGTFKQQTVDSFQRIVELAPHCGPNPTSIIVSRINMFEMEPEKYLKNFKPSEISQLCSYLSRIRNLIMTEKELFLFINAICGFSIRKALYLARYILISPMMNVFSDKEFTDFSIIRAILTGPSKTYIWSDSHVVDNIFWVQGTENEVYLLKPRILKILKAKDNDSGIFVERLISILETFEYSLDDIALALNQMVNPTKRLIWTDGVFNFNTPDELIKSNKQKIYLSKAGIGYIEVLINELEYVQEMLLDTPMPTNQFNYKVEYNNIWDRLSTVFHFLNFLVLKEISENRLFLKRYSPSIYQKQFNTSSLITKSIVQKCYNSCNTILDSIENSIENRDRAIQFKGRRKERNYYFDYLYDSVANWDIKKASDDIKLLYVPLPINRM
jgi:energy-coupling factor transporter ATP-binding protein EcfA2